jgi:CheY-like chemotaxis protein
LLTYGYRAMAKILLAEDHHLTRATLGKFLRGIGYDVELAPDGTQAVSLLKEHEFDLVLSDVVMPNGSGWDLVDHLSAVSPDTPVLLMTAYTPLLQSRQAQSGVKPELILKPLVLTDLLARIQKLLGRKRSS